MRRVRIRPVAGVAVFLIALTVGIVQAPLARAGSISDATQPNVIEWGTQFCDPAPWSAWHKFDLAAHGISGSVRVTGLTLGAEGPFRVSVYSDPLGSFPATTNGLILRSSTEVASQPYVSAFEFRTIPLDYITDPGEAVVVEVNFYAGLGGIGFNTEGDNYSGYLSGCNGYYGADPFPFSSGSLPWTLTTAEVSATDLLNRLTALVDSYALGRLGTSLHDKLVTVQRALVGGKTAQACENLRTFDAQVAAQTGKGLTADQANALLSNSHRIEQLTGC